MGYAAQADVANAVGGNQRLIELFDWDRDGVVANPDPTITDCIAEADALIDSFAAKRFHVPFNPIPEIIKRTSAKLAVLIGVRRRGMLTDDQQAEWDRIAGTETNREGWLFQLATGVVVPGGDPLPLPHSTMVADEVDTTMPDDRDAARSKLAGWW